MFTISRPTWNFNVIGLRSSPTRKNYKFTYFKMLALCMLLHLINKVKVMHQGQGQSKNIYLLPILCKIVLISTYLILCMWL